MEKVNPFSVIWCHQGHLNLSSMYLLFVLILTLIFFFNLRIAYASTIFTYCLLHSSCSPPTHSLWNYWSLLHTPPSPYWVHLEQFLCLGLYYLGADNLSEGLSLEKTHSLSQQPLMVCSSSSSAGALRESPISTGMSADVITQVVFRQSYCWDFMVCSFHVLYRRYYFKADFWVFQLLQSPTPLLWFLLSLCLRGCPVDVSNTGGYLTVSSYHFTSFLTIFPPLNFRNHLRDPAQSVSFLYKIHLLPPTLYSFSIISINLCCPSLST